MTSGRPACTLAALLLLAACGGGGASDPATPPAGYVQADLTGTWDRLVLLSNDGAGWNHQVLSFDAAGAVTYTSCRNHLGPFTCATAATTFLVDAAGTVSQGGVGGNPNFKGALSRGKDLLIGTATSGAAHNLQVFRKRIPGLAYAQADLSGPFAYHLLETGGGLRWERGAGAVSAAGAVTVTSTLDSAGDQTPPPDPADQLTVTADGLVTLANIGLLGFVTPDKQVAFLVGGAGPGTANTLLALVRSGGSYAQGDLTGAWGFHILSTGATQATSGWLRGTATYDAGGAATFTQVSGSAGTTSVAGFTATVGPTGATTRADLASFQGQLSLGKDLTVRTQTAGGVTSLGLALRR